MKAAALLLAVVAQTGDRPDSESRILAGESASAVLSQWCAAHGLGALIAQREPQADGRPSRKVLSALGPHSLNYRRVRLTCGGRTLSIADNWYVPVQA